MLDDEITIHEAPTKAGYKFVEWRGSSYQPGDAYTVTEDHTFTAVWESTATAVDTGDDMNISGLIALMCLALAGIVTALLLGRRREM